MNPYFNPAPEEPERWWLKAECAKPENSWVFIKTEIERAQHLHMVRAKEICAGCPVLAQCRAEALYVEAGRTKGESVGVVGGMSAREREKVTRSWCRQCQRGERVPGISFCQDCREERRLRRYREALSA